MSQSPPRSYRLVVDPSQIHPPLIDWTDQQQHYLNRVLRLTIGDRVVVMDGQGHLWQVELSHPDQATLIATIETRAELAIAVTLVCALPKGNAFDEVIRQCTELGVTVIQPVISERTVLHPSAQKCDRWRRIAQEATEQCERAIVPTLLDPVPLREYLHHSTPGLHYVCAERRNSQHLLTHLVRLDLTADLAISVAIGPEGGWTDAELTAFEAAQYQLVSLGPRILRAVTAPVMVMSLMAATVETSKLEAG